MSNKVGILFHGVVLCCAAILGTFLAEVVIPKDAPQQQNPAAAPPAQTAALRPSAPPALLVPPINAQPIQPPPVVAASHELPVLSTALTMQVGASPIIQTVNSFPLSTPVKSNGPTENLLIVVRKADDKTTLQVQVTASDQSPISGILQNPAHNAPADERTFQVTVNRTGKYIITATNAGHPPDKKEFTVAIKDDFDVQFKIDSITSKPTTPPHVIQNPPPGKVLVMHPGLFDVHVTTNTLVPARNLRLRFGEKTGPIVNGNNSPLLSSMLLSAGRYDMVVEDVWSGRSSEKYPVQIPDPNPGVKPRITHVALNQDAPLEPYDRTKPLPIYGGYLRIRGEGVMPSNQQLRALVYKKHTKPEQFVLSQDFIVAVSRPAVGVWETTLNFQDLYFLDGQLFLATEGGNTHVFSDPSQISLEPKTTPQGTPTITTISADETLPRPYRTNKTEITIAGNGPRPNTAKLMIVEPRTRQKFFESGVVTSGNDWTVNVTGLKSGDYQFQAAWVLGTQVGKYSPVVKVQIRTKGPTVTELIPPNFGTAPGVKVLTIQFTPGHLLHERQANTDANYELLGSKGTGVFNQGANGNPVPTAKYDPQRNQVNLTFANLEPDLYQLRIKTSLNGETGIKDVYGNPLVNEDGVSGVDYLAVMRKPAGIDDAEAEQAARRAVVMERRGLAGDTGPHVAFPEFTPFREVPDGFNPSDKVVTAVARLYYFRDAHRVVQIINRRAKSYNRVAVDTAERLAAETREAAAAAQDKRRAMERKSVQAATQAREAERALQIYQEALANARQQNRDANERVFQAEGQVRTLQSQPTTNLTEAERQDLQRRIQGAQADLNRLRAEASDAQSQIAVNEQRVSAAAAGVQALRQDELSLREEAEVASAREERTAAVAFRQAVAAANEDPDTYVPGEVCSDDPVTQVSLSVIGEGLIQLRGPRKGVNTVRLMINQIDTPVSQVRLGVHTIQVNGERGDRMEPVVTRIQRYIDHSRFLTVQSGQMLRNAVVLVASRRAQAIAGQCQGLSQSERDRKYQEAFFGAEFLAELATLDSEFLDTGNKLLSLHAMDSTSLASALFLFALAKNDVRLEILAEFEGRVATQLPHKELEYFTASGAEFKFGPMFCKKEFQFFAHNARFVSLRGFFEHEAVGVNTLTPLQREFIRLAQVFKSRLVVEREWRLRVMERSLIEERLGDYVAQLHATRNREFLAQKAVKEARETRNEQHLVVSTEFSKFNSMLAGKVKWWQQEYETGLPITALKELEGNQNPLDLTQPLRNRRSGDFSIQYRGQPVAITVNRPPDEEIQMNTYSASEVRRRITITPEDKFKPTWKAEFERVMKLNRKVLDFLSSLDFWNSTQHQILQREENYLVQVETSFQNDPNSAPYIYRNLYILGIGNRSLLELTNPARDHYLVVARSILSTLRRVDANISTVYQRWISLREPLLQIAPDDPHVLNIDKGFDKLMESELKVQLAMDIAEGSRRPLDHKKFLDMLIDDVEEKYIDLLEGTRSHIAVIDNYIQRLATALDDDFNTQFYNPAFRAIRETGRYWDVSFGQIETTTVLTNNRAFARVAPQATMEFDLPKRDILIAEAFDAAAAVYQDYGALMADPSFLALTKMYSGQPTSSQFSGSPNPGVRDILPGLPSVTDEHLLLQADLAAPDQPSALESLIPDPAIYKFETGTAFQLRPVIQPDGQAVVFHFNYMYTTNVREPVRADEKHLGRVKRHFVDTDVQLGNYELREASRYRVALKASRTSRGVPLLEDVPALGVLFRPLPQSESSLQENIILTQATIFPTLFDLMGLRWAPAVADLDPLRLREKEFVTRGRRQRLQENVFDYSSFQVDHFLRVPPSERRTDLYRPQSSIPYEHPNGYSGPGLNLRDSRLQEGFTPHMMQPESRFIPSESSEGVPLTPGRYEPQEGPSFPSRNSYPLPQENFRSENLGTTVVPYIPPTQRPLSPMVLPHEVPPGYSPRQAPYDSGNPTGPPIGAPYSPFESTPGMISPPREIHAPVPKPGFVPAPGPVPYHPTSYTMPANVTNAQVVKEEATNPPGKKKWFRVPFLNRNE